MEINFNPPKIPKCKNCGRQKGKHKAHTLNCPIGLGNFPQFMSEQSYEPKPTRKPKDTINVKI